MAGGAAERGGAMRRSATPRATTSVTPRRANAAHHDARTRAAVLVQRVWRGWWSRRLIVDGVELAFNAIAAELDGAALHRRPWSWPAATQSPMRTIERYPTPASLTVSPAAIVVRQMDEMELPHDELSPVRTRHARPRPLPGCSRWFAYGVLVTRRACVLQLRPVVPAGVQWSVAETPRDGLAAPGASPLGSAPTTPLHCPASVEPSAKKVFGTASTRLGRVLVYDDDGKRDDAKPCPRATDSSDSRSPSSGLGDAVPRVAVSPIGSPASIAAVARLDAEKMTEAERRAAAERLESELRWTEAALHSRVQHLIDTSQCQVSLSPKR